MKTVKLIWSHRDCLGKPSAVDVFFFFICSARAQTKQLGRLDYPTECLDKQKNHHTTML